MDCESCGLPMLQPENHGANDPVQVLCARQQTEKPGTNQKGVDRLPCENRKHLQARG